MQISAFIVYNIIGKVLLIDFMQSSNSNKKSKSDKHPINFIHASREWKMSAYSLVISVKRCIYTTTVEFADWMKHQSKINVKLIMYKQHSLKCDCTIFANRNLCQQFFLYISFILYYANFLKGLNKVPCFLINTFRFFK